MLSVPQTVTVQRVLDVMYAQPARDLQRLRHGRSRRVRCHFAEALPHGRARGPIGCTIRIYRHWNLTGRIAIIPVDVTITSRRHRITFEDGSFAATYSAHRSLVGDPLPRSQ